MRETAGQRRKDAETGAVVGRLYGQGGQDANHDGTKNGFTRLRSHACGRAVRLVVGIGAQTDLLHHPASNSGQFIIGKRADFAGAAVSFRDWPQAYEEYRRLAGNGAKHPEHGLGAKDFLDSVIRGRSPMSAAYRRMSDGPQGSKAVFIRHTIGRYRRLAQQQVLRDRRFRDFAAYVQRLKTLKNNASIPGGKA